MRRPTRREVAAALLVSLPPGVGLAGLASVLMEEALTPGAAAVGVLVTAVLFAFLMVGVAVGESDDHGFSLPENDDHNR